MAQSATLNIVCWFAFSCHSFGYVSLTIVSILVLSVLFVLFLSSFLFITIIVLILLSTSVRLRAYTSGPSHTVFILFIFVFNIVSVFHLPVLLWHCLVWWWWCCSFSLFIMPFILFLHFFIDKWTDPHAHTHMHAIYMLRMVLSGCCWSHCCGVYMYMHVWFLCENSFAYFAGSSYSSCFCSLSLRMCGAVLLLLFFHSCLFLLFFFFVHSAQTTYCWEMSASARLLARAFTVCRMCFDSLFSYCLCMWVCLLLWHECWVWPIFLVSQR